MTSRRRLAALLAVSGLLAAAAASAGGALLPCSGGELNGAFVAVRGSAGAGQISYTLRLRNRSQRACFVSGIPALQLLDLRGRALPTHTAPARPGALTAVRVLLRPGGYAAASARFSPDIPGRGEPETRRCEPVAHRLRVRPAGGGALVVPLAPPTSVCEHGAMLLSVLVAGRDGPAA